MDTSQGSAPSGTGLHLLLIDPAFRGPESPGPSRGYDLITRAVAAGHRATVLTCGTEGLASPVPGLTVRGRGNASQRTGWDVTASERPRFARWAARAMWRVKEVDILIVAEMSVAFLVPAAWYAWVRAIPLIDEIRALPPAGAPPTAPMQTRLWSATKRIGRRMARWLPHRTIVASPAIAAAMSAAGLSDAKRLQLPAGCDPKLLAFAAGAENAVLREAPELGGHPLVVWAGAFTPDRQVPRLVDLAAALQNVAPQATLVLCGEGPMRAEVIRLIHEHGLPESAIMVLGPLPRLRMADLLAAATVVLALPSANDTASDFFDALAAGKPVVYLGDGWPRELLENRGAGAGAALDDSTAAAREVADLLRDEDGLRRAGQQAAALSASRFNLDRLTADIRIAIEELVADTPRAETLRRRTLFCKRAFDLTFALMAKTVLLPVIAVLSVLVGVKLGWPIVVAHDRAGLKGKPFRLYKFRTLTDAEDPTGALLPESERLTPFGRFLRRTALDELPTLANVVLGHMSLVGPRPYPVAYTAYYTPAQRRRLDLRPGLTGLAQVDTSADRGWDAKFACDLEYIDRVSLGLDAKILLKTLWVLLRGRNLAAQPIMPRFDEMMAHREGAEDA